MDGGKRIVDVDIAEPRQLAGESRFVRRLLAMEPHVLQEEDVAGAPTLDRIGDRRTDAVFQLPNWTAEQIRQTGRGRSELQTLDHASLRPPEVRDQHHLRVVFEQVMQSGERSAKPRIVGDSPPGQRHVVVDPHQDYLPLNVCTSDTA